MFVSTSDHLNFFLHAVRSLANCILLLWLTECDESSTLANSSSNHRQIYRSTGTSLSKIPNLAREARRACSVFFVRLVCLQPADPSLPFGTRLVLRLMLGKRAIHCPRTAETATTTLYEPYALVASCVPPPPPRATGSLVGSWSTPSAAAPLSHAARQCVPAAPASARPLGVKGHATRRHVAMSR